MYYNAEEQVFYVVDAAIDAFRKINKSGTQIAVVQPQVGGSNYVPNAGDMGSDVNITYVVPIDISVVNSGSSERLSSFSFDFDDNGGAVTGAQMMYQGSIISDGDVIRVNTNAGLAYARVDVDGTNQIWTINFLVDSVGVNDNTANNTVTSVTNASDFEAKVSTAQNNDFSIDITGYASLPNSATVTLQHTSSVTVDINNDPVTVDSQVDSISGTNYIFASSDFAFSDADSGDSIQAIRIDTLPSDGTLQLYDGSTWNNLTINDVVTVTQLNSGYLRYSNSGVASNIDSTTFDYEVHDGANYSNTATMTVTIGYTYTGTTGVDTLTGGAGNDQLNAGPGDDLLIGAGGSDNLRGHLDNDIFKWNAGDEGTVTNPAVDTIENGFVLGNNLDQLDLQSMLTGESDNTIANYLSFNYSGSNTTIDVMPNGDGNVTQQIVINNTDLTAGNSLTDLEILTNLLNNNQLIIDH